MRAVRRRRTAAVAILAALSLTVATGCGDDAEDAVDKGQSVATEVATDARSVASEGAEGGQSVASDAQEGAESAGDDLGGGDTGADGVSVEGGTVTADGGVTGQNGVETTP